MNRYFTIFIFLFLATLLPAQKQTTLYQKADKQKLNAWVDSVYNRMSLDEKVGQLFMPVANPDNSYKTRITNYIKNQKVGGLLFSKGTLASQAEITNYAQSISDIPLFIALDGEWGLSMRLTDAPAFPRNMILGAITDDQIIYNYGKEIARQCKEMGIHINFAPSVDVNSNPNNPVIGTRAFGADPANVARQGIAYAKGLEEGGVMAVAKHFPGHGDTSEDSHKTLPTISHSNARLNAVELFPFKQYIESGLSGLMIGHLDVPALNTNGLPSSLSPNIGEKLLKDEMGFTGLVFTDGMAMRGVSTQMNASVKALLAGNDIVLGVINQYDEFQSVKEAVEKGTIPAKMLEEKVKKILAYKYILGVPDFTPIKTGALRKQINTPETEWVQRKIYDGALTLIKNEGNTVPVTGLETKAIACVTIGASSADNFSEMLKKYADVRIFRVSSIANLSAIETQLKDFDLVIISVHLSKMADNAALQRLTKNKNAILVFFTSPFELNQYKVSCDNAKSVLVAQDDSKFAQMSAAQGIFGGISITGKLQVPAGNLPMNTGITTEKIRLSYNLPEETGIASDKLDKIERIALDGIGSRAYPGCQILIAKDGVVIYEKAFGNFEYGKGSRVTDETVYDLASVTKAAATLPAVMKLYDESKLRLQDNISRFVPETKGSNKANISIRELLFHESGITSFIPYYESAIDKNSFSGPLFGRRSKLYHARYAGAYGRTDYRFLPALISSKESATFNLPVTKDMYASGKMHDVLLKDIIDTELRSKTYRYSCLNFMLLKEAVENITKEDLNTFVEENFYRKLGATTTTFQPMKYMSINDIPPTENDPFFRKQLVRGYVHDEGAALFGGISGNAGLFSNANDLAKLCQMWLDGGEYGGERFLSEETVRLFTKTKSSSSRRGLGFDKPDPRNNNASPTSPLAPITVYGHTGYTGTCFWVDPTNNLIYIFLSNRVYPSRSPNRLSSMNIRERIQDEIYKAINK